MVSHWAGGVTGGALALWHARIWQDGDLERMKDFRDAIRATPWIR
jgi:hypothetical protein